MYTIQINMSTAQTGPVEVGVFDLSLIPVLWQNIEPEKLEEAMHRIESTVDEQITQLQSRVDEQKKPQNNQETKE
jgi:hypothetical protein